VGVVDKKIKLLVFILKAVSFWYVILTYTVKDAPGAKLLGEDTFSFITVALRLNCTVVFDSA
jgi:hypothetical protein